MNVGIITLISVTPFNFESDDSLKALDRSLGVGEIHSQKKQH